MVLVTRLEGWLADRRVRLARSWGAYSHGYRVHRYRAASLLVALAVAAVAVGVAMGSRVGTPDPTETDPPAPNIDAAPGLDVPDVRGMSAPQARAVLERSGLRFEWAIAAEGTPGRVLGTLPSIGRSVSSGTAVTLIVGVGAERLVAGLVSSVWPEDSSASP